MTGFYQLDLFAASLPRWLACTDHPADGITRLPGAEALKRAHIAPNSRNLAWALTFDIDHPEAGAAWIDADLPQPNWIAQNTKNGHAHLGYALLVPVSRSLLSRGCPQRYMARIQHAMTEGLRADRAYTHFLTKTPGHARWRTIWGRQQPYGLDELRHALPENLPLPRKISRREAVGFGRNVSLFDSLRAWAYRARLEYSRFETWQDTCLRHAESLNTFAAPLPLSELRSTARSVAKWTWANISPAGFAERQAQRQARQAAKRQATTMQRLMEFCV